MAIRTAYNDIGKKFGRLTVLDVYYQYKEGYGSYSWAKCECECGVKKDVQLGLIKCGKTKSCGCARNAQIASEGRRKRHPNLWLISNEDLQKIVSDSKSYLEVARRLKINANNGVQPQLVRRFEDGKINYDNLKDGQGRYVTRDFTDQRILPKDYLIYGKPPRQVKERMFRDKVLEEKCIKCGMGPIWQNEKITLQLDHIDGDRFNNILENLRILCPNCHSQTETFGSKNKRKYTEQERIVLGTQKLSKKHEAKIKETVKVKE